MKVKKPHHENPLIRKIKVQKPNQENQGSEKKENPLIKQMKVKKPIMKIP